MKAMTKTVPLSLHEDNLNRFYIRDSETGEQVADHAIDVLHSAAAFSRETATKLLAAHKAIMADQMATPLANQKKARDTAKRMLESVTLRIDSAVKIAHEERKALLAKLAGPAKPKDYLEASQAGEIRSALLHLSPSERAKEIAEALAEDDDIVVSAVLNGRKVTSGITKQESEMLRFSWAQRRYPGDVDRAARLDEAMETLLRGGRAAITLVSGLSDGEKIAAAEKSAREAAEAAKV